LKARCTACEAVHVWREGLAGDHACPSCESSNTLRQQVVWFGEMPLALDEIYAALAGCDLFLAIGTSGQVYPAAGFVEEARRHGRARTVELNLEPSAISSVFDEHHHGPASKIVPPYVEQLLAG
jgi:NAD-dependent deacetylase